MSKHDTMADNSTDAPTESERWTYHGIGSGHARGELFGAMYEDRPAKAQVYPVRDAEVHFGVVVGEDDADGPTFDADINITADHAESLARDLLEAAALARDQADE